MTLVADAPVKAQPIFGQITLADMRQNEKLTKTVMPMVRDACKHSKGRYTATKVADGLITGEFRLWGVMRLPADLRAVAVTKIDGAVFDIILIGPDFEEMFDALPKLQSAARSAGCVSMRVTGPHFWRRQLPEGWKMSAVIYERLLEPLA